MYVSLHFPFAPQYFPQKTLFFQRFRKDDVQKHRVFPVFWQKDAGSPSQQKSRQGESSLGPLFCDTGSPKTTFSGTSSNCRAVLGGGGGPPPPGGGYPLSSLRCPTRREMSADIHTCIHYIHTYMHTLHTYVHTYIHACIHYIPTYLHTYIHNIK